MLHSILLSVAIFHSAFRRPIARTPLATYARQPLRPSSGVENTHMVACLPVVACAVTCSLLQRATSTHMYKDNNSFKLAFVYRSLIFTVRAKS